MFKKDFPHNRLMLIFVWRKKVSILQIFKNKSKLLTNRAFVRVIRAKSKSSSTQCQYPPPLQLFSVNTIKTFIDVSMKKKSKLWLPFRMQDILSHSFTRPTFSESKQHFWNEYANFYLQLKNTLKPNIRFFLTEIFVLLLIFYL